MANEKDRYTDPITLEYIQITYNEFAKKLFIDYSYLDDSIRAAACMEFLKHYFFNTSDESIELFKKKNPSAGMFFDILDSASEQRQNNARWSSWENFYKQDETKSIEDILEERQREKKAKKKESNKKEYNKKKKRNFEEIKIKREKEAKQNLKSFADEHGIDIDVDY